MAQNRIRILTKSELHSLYGLPLFSDNERHDYLSLNDAGNSFMAILLNYLAIAILICKPNALKIRLRVSSLGFPFPESK